MRQIKCKSIFSFQTVRVSGHPKFCSKSLSASVTPVLLSWPVAETRGYFLCQCSGKNWVCSYIFCGTDTGHFKFFFAVASKMENVQLKYLISGLVNQFLVSFLFSLKSHSYNWTNFEWEDRNDKSSVLSCFTDRKKPQIPTYRRRSIHYFLPFTVFFTANCKNKELLSPSLATTMPACPSHYIYNHANSMPFH